MKTNCPICDTELPLQESSKDLMKGVKYYHCKPCGIYGKGKNAEEAKKDLINNSVTTSREIVTTAPKAPSDVVKWKNHYITTLRQQSANFLNNEEIEKLIENNTRYLIKAELKDAWNTTEGQMSIAEAYIEALEMGAFLGKMADIVPFGKVVELIEGISAFEFALSSGKNPMFKDINIECVYSNDKYEASRENGNFTFNLKMGIPRGEVIGVVVQAYDIERGAVIGEVYDANRLMEKAKQHSKSYQYYLADMQALREAQGEGKDYIEKWNRKFYEKDITNPYVNANKPEMLRKVAGKSFFRPYMKIRNARAMDSASKEKESTDDKSGDVYVNTLETSLSSVKDVDFEMAEAVQDTENTEEKDGELFQEGI